MMQARLLLSAVFFVGASFLDVGRAEAQALPADDEVVLPTARPARAPTKAAAPRSRPQARRRRPPRSSEARPPAPEPTVDEPRATTPPALTPTRPPGEIVRTLVLPAAPRSDSPAAPAVAPISCIFEEEEPPEGFPTHGAWVRRKNQFIVSCERERTRRAAEARRLREEEERRRVEEARRRAEEDASRRELAEAEARARREAEERARLDAERRQREDAERRLREEDMIRREQAQYRARREAELREEQEREAPRNERAAEPVETGAQGAPEEGDAALRLEAELDRQEAEERREEDETARRAADVRARRSAREDRRRRGRTEERAPRPLPPAIFEIEAGLSATTRSQVLDDTGGSTVRFGLTPFASAIGTLRLTPLARLGKGPTGLGVEGTYDRALRMEASLDGKALAAAADHLAVMGLYDFRLPGGVVLEPRLGYDLARFELEPNETLAGIVYESIAFAVLARIPVLGEKLRVRFGATMYFLIGLGEAAARYGQSGSASGFQVEGGLEGTVSGHFGYFALLEHTSYTATFRGAADSDVETTSEDGITTGLCGARASF